MNRSELRQLIREEIQRINEANYPMPKVDREGVQLMKQAIGKIAPDMLATAKKKGWLVAVQTYKGDFDSVQHVDPESFQAIHDQGLWGGKKSPSGYSYHVLYVPNNFDPNGR